MNEIKLGHYYKAKPQFTVLADHVGGVARCGSGAIQPKLAAGKCVYIHPKGRFVTLEFPVRSGVLRECFRTEEVG